MKAIFLTQNPEHIANVFQNDVREQIASLAEFDCKVYNKKDVLEGDFSDVDYVFSTWGMPHFTEEEIKENLPSLKAVFYAAGSVQGFAREFLNCGVKVFSAWAANAVPVAEYTLAQIVLANKGYFKTSVMMKRGERKEGKELLELYKGNYSAKVGIIGAGMIGSLVLEMLKGYDLYTMTFDPFMSEEKAEKLGTQKTDLETLFKECDVVSNHLANNAQTKGMLNKTLFESMPKYATFINTGRGAQVVESDLIEVLNSREDLTAILDVTDPEPPCEGSQLYTLPNCILTPHIAGSSGKEVCRMAKYMADEFSSLVKGENCRYEVTLKMLETMA